MLSQHYHPHPSLGHFSSSTLQCLPLIRHPIPALCYTEIPITEPADLAYITACTGNVYVSRRPRDLSIALPCLASFTFFQPRIGRSKPDVKLAIIRQQTPRKKVKYYYNRENDQATGNCFHYLAETCAWNKLTVRGKPLPTKLGRGSLLDSARRCRLRTSNTPARWMGRLRMQGEGGRGGYIFNIPAAILTELSHQPY